MSPSADAVRCTVALCVAKDCAARPEHADLADALAGEPGCEVVESRCLDVCKGPVVVVSGVGDEPVVLRRVRRRKQRRDLIRYLRGGRLTMRLQDLELRGRDRRVAIARVRPKR